MAVWWTLRFQNLSNLHKHILCIITIFLISNAYSAKLWPDKELELVFRQYFGFNLELSAACIRPAEFAFSSTSSWWVWNTWPQTLSKTRRKSPYFCLRISMVYIWLSKTFPLLVVEFFWNNVFATYACALRVSLRLILILRVSVYLDQWSGMIDWKVTCFSA